MSCEANGGQEQHLAEYTSEWDLHFDPFFRCEQCGWVEGGDGSSESTKQARIAAHKNLPPDVHVVMIETHKKLLAGTLFIRSGYEVVEQPVISAPNGSSDNNADGTQTAPSVVTVAEA